MPQTPDVPALRSRRTVPGARHGRQTDRRLTRILTTAVVCGGIVASIAGTVSAKGPSATLVAPSVLPDASALPGASPVAIVAPSAGATDEVRFCGEPTPAPSASPTPSVDPSASASPVPSFDPGASASVGPSPSPSPKPTPAPTPCPAIVMPQIGVGVGPSSIVLGLDRDHGTFTVYNAGETQESFSITASDFTLDGDGNRVPAAEPIPQGASAWMDIQPATFTLEPQESQLVEVTVKRPDIAPPGDHFASLNVLGRMSDEAWDELKPQIGGAAIARSQLLFPVTVVARVPGEVKPWVEVPPFADTYGPLIASISGDVMLSPRIVNQGNVAAVWQPSGTDPDASAVDTVPTLQLTNQLGFLAGDKVVYAGAGAERPSTVLVLPGATVQQDLVIHDAPIIGVYDYVYTLPGDAADGRAPITSIGHLTIVNLQKVALYIVLPLLVLLAVGGLLLVRRSHRRMRLQLTAAQHRAEMESIRAEALEQARREEALRNSRPW